MTADPKITLELNASEVQTVMYGLNELPRKVSDPVFLKISVQVQTQLAPKKKEEKEDENNS